MVTLRPYQIDLKNKIYELWAENKRNVLAVAPTGAGKTEIKGSLFAENQNYPAVAIAHRQELVEQISRAMAKHGIVHRIIAPQKLISFCIHQHIKYFGKSFYHHAATVAVCGVDTLIRRGDDMVQWQNHVRIWDIDEAHHVLAANKWGTAVSMFPNAWGLGFTATPMRGDRRGLGRHAQGVFDAMALGPAMSDLIDAGYLSKYRCYGPPSSIDVSQISIAADGDFSQPQLRKQAHESTITGDIVTHYLRLAPGKLGITFTVDVELAKETAAAFIASGVPAAAVSAKTPDDIRVKTIERFQRGDLKQLVNVDLFGEGVDVPGVEVVSAGRPTQSFPVFAQQFGRMMRLAPGKEFGIYIDHVGNIKRHNGPPDRPRVWTLDDYEHANKKAGIKPVPVRICESCFRDYEGLSKTCPHCGFVHEPQDRSKPEFVDGDLTEYSDDLLDRLYGAVKANMRPFDGQPQSAAETVIARNIGYRIDAQRELQDVIALWAGIGREVDGLSDSQMYRKFYLVFGIDVLTAMTLGRPETERLTALVRSTFV